uniref:cold-shock protein n=1 Tax=Acinetobacter baumannii TaxID=470 RepID=UPI0013D46CBD
VLDAEWRAAADFDPDMIPHGAEVLEVYGAIRWFDPRAGFGYIVPDNGSPEATIHATTLKDSGFSVAPLGATVSCQIIETLAGLRVH